MAECKETKELLVAAGDIAVVIFKAQKTARKSDGSLDAQSFAQNIAAQLMTQPQVVDHLKAAFENVSAVPQEVKGLGMMGAFDLISTAGMVAARCAAAVQN